MKVRTSIEAKYNKAFNCHACLSRYAGQPNSDKRSMAFRTSRNCFGTVRKTYLIESFRFGSCVGNFTCPSINYYIELFLAYEKGVLPFEGALGSQPNKIMEIFSVISAVKAEKDEAARKESNRKGRRGR